MTAPLTYRWTGEAMEPLPRHMRQANSEFVVGETYTLAELQDRSRATHAHYFACVNEAWLNLSEEAAERFATADHLRRYALIRTGFHDERSIVCASKAEAGRVAAFVKPSDPFALVIVQGASVTVYTAKSQSMKAMGRKVFQESKEAVLGYLAAMIGVEPKELSSQGSGSAEQASPRAA